MSTLVFGKDVELRPHAIDRYGRTVAMVFVDGRDVGLELIKTGLAWAYEHYLPEASPDIQAQYTAIFPLPFLADFRNFLSRLSDVAVYWAIGARDLSGICFGPPGGGRALFSAQQVSFEELDLE